jgi:hypothetical protein
MVMAAVQRRAAPGVPMKIMASDTIRAGGVRDAR